VAQDGTLFRRPIAPIRRFGIRLSKSTNDYFIRFCVDQLRLAALDFGSIKWHTCAHKGDVSLKAGIDNRRIASTGLSATSRRTH
jgi:hypothetical protein